MVVELILNSAENRRLPCAQEYQSLFKLIGREIAGKSD
jgi:hypothetical protein